MYQLNIGLMNQRDTVHIELILQVNVILPRETSSLIRLIFIIDFLLFTFRGVITKLSAPDFR